MRYVTIINKAKRTGRYFAEDVDRALDIALSIGHARKRDNLTVVADREVCQFCYIYEGHAALRISPLPRVYLAATLTERHEQLDRGTLHTDDECRYSK